MNKAERLQYLTKELGVVLTHNKVVYDAVMVEAHGEIWSLLGRYIPEASSVGALGGAE